MSRIPHFINNTDIGQNFLIDHSVVDYIIKKAALAESDKVLEVGPGDGILTRGLLSTQCAGVCTVELDTRLRHTLDMMAIEDKRLVPLWGDAVQFDYVHGLPWRPTRVIANLPYHITTPLIWTLLEQLAPLGLSYMLLMVQLESAQRMTAEFAHHERSPLGITIEAMGRAAILRNVSPTAFHPQPHVMSCIIEIKLEKNRALAVNRTWRALLARSFAQRRKTLVNNWMSGYAGMTRDAAAAVLERLQLKPASRAEELTSESWFELAEQPEFQAAQVRQK